MKDKIINSLINNIKRYYNYDEKKIIEIKYGLESLLLSIFKLIVIFFISFFIHITKELCLLLLFYGILRLTAFGLHTSKSYQCWIASLLTFTIVPYLIKISNINNKCLISIIPFIIICIYAPSDTKKRPLINKKKRIVYKIISIIISIIYILLICFLNSNTLKNVFFYSLILESLLILPISYKLFGLTYNNYKSYIRKEGNK